MTAYILDVRPAGQFAVGHRPGAANIPLDELPRRVHELPPSGVDLIVFDVEPGRVRAAAALLAPGRWNVTLVESAEWLAAGPIECGATSARLWQPHGLLVEAMPIIASAWGEVRGRRAVDLACGTGRDAVYLAELGFDVEAIDILPDALERADDLARRNGVVVRTRCADLEAGGALAVDAADLVTGFNFLHRPLWEEIRAAVRAGGFVVYETFLKASREAFGRPTRDARLLEPGELAAAFGDWRAVVYREGPSGARRIAAGIVAQKPR